MKRFAFIFNARALGRRDVDTLLGMAQTALRRGLKGTNAFLKEQRASGAPSAAGSYDALIEVLESSDRVIGTL